VSKINQLVVESDKCQLWYKEMGRGQTFQRHSFIIKSKDVSLVLQFEHTAPASSGTACLYATVDISSTVPFRVQIQ